MRPTIEVLYPYQTRSIVGFTHHPFPEAFPDVDVPLGCDKDFPARQVGIIPTAFGTICLKHDPFTCAHLNLPCIPRIMYHVLVKRGKPTPQAPY